MPLTDNQILTPSAFHWPLTFTLRRVEAGCLTTEMCSRRLTDFEAAFIPNHALVEDESSLLGLPNGAATIPANKNPEFWTYCLARGDGSWGVARIKCGGFIDAYSARRRIFGCPRCATNDLHDRILMRCISLYVSLYSSMVDRISVFQDPSDGGNVVGLVGMFTLIVFASWLGIRILRGQFNLER